MYGLIKKIGEGKEGPIGLEVFPGEFSRESRDTHADHWHVCVDAEWN
jgi:hypothetical protein